jgi:hypothetical protein
MNKKELFSLINGSFDTEEANSILTDLFTTKIHFHEMKNFSSKERFGKEDDGASIRIAELKQSVQKISKIISLSKKQGKKLKISSTVNIQIVEND